VGQFALRSWDAASIVIPSKLVLRSEGSGRADSRRRAKGGLPYCKLTHYRRDDYCRGAIVRRAIIARLLRQNLFWYKPEFQPCELPPFSNAESGNIRRMDMTFDETLYCRHDDEMDDYGDGSYGDSLEDEEYEEEEEEEEEPESTVVIEEVEAEEPEPEVTTESRAPAPPQNKSAPVKRAAKKAPAKKKTAKKAPAKKKAAKKPAKKAEKRAPRKPAKKASAKKKAAKKAPARKKAAKKGHRRR
jgi:hypothetical protein